MLDLLNYDKKVSEIWKDEMVETISMISKDDNKDEIRKIIEQIYKERYRKVTMAYRNVYKYENGYVDPDETLMRVYGKEGKLLGANGTLMDNHEENPSITLKLILKLKQIRSVFKGLMLKAKGEGDFDLEEENKMKSNVIKSKNNAIYGNQAMEGSLFASIDSAQLITTQAKNETTEMAWTMEKLLENNLAFDSFNECVLYIKNTIKYSQEEKDKMDELMHYIDYYPTDEDLKIRYQEMIETAENSFDFNTRIVYELIPKLDKYERLRFFYKNNLITFMDKNPKIIDLLEVVMAFQDDIDLDEIEKRDRKDPIFKELLLEANIKKAIEPYKSTAEKFIEIMNTYVTNLIPTHRRVSKYTKYKRKSIVISDTDSVILTVHPIIKFFQEKYKDKGINVYSKYFELKCTMFLAIYLSNVLRKACDILGKSLNVPENYLSELEFKNEFYFSRVICYPKIKKNYIANNIVQEGQLIPEKSRISYTGINTVSSELNKVMTQRIKSEIIEELIVKKDNIDTLEIYKKIMSLQDEMVKAIKSGNKAYGSQIKFRGGAYYGDRLKLLAKPRACVTWNRICPMNEITLGDTAYLYQTKVRTIKDAESLIKDTEVLKIIKEEIFNINQKYSPNDDFSKFGLVYLAIPKSGLPNELPNWFIDIIDYDVLLEKTFKIISRLIPGLNLKLSKSKNNTKMISPIIEF